MSDPTGYGNVTDDYEKLRFDRDPYPYYYHWMFISFIVCVFLHHVASPFIFRRYNKPYNECSWDKRMEWDSRVVSSIHATTVCILCLLTLLTDREVWRHPITYPSRIGLIALSISIGYFCCDIISMPIYWRGLPLIIFIIHHSAAAAAFLLVVRFRVCTFFGVYRLTTELSTPFTNQRWFYRTIGYKPDRRRVCTVTLMFAILFALTRNFMIIPFWLIVYQSTYCEAYASSKTMMPWLDVAFVIPCLVLDALNIYWAAKTYRIGWKAAKALWNADWSSDIQLAKTRLRRRLRRLRRRTASDSVDRASLDNQSVNAASPPSEIPNVPPSSSSSSNYSSDSEYEEAAGLGSTEVPNITQDDALLSSKIIDHSSGAIENPEDLDQEVIHRSI
ncbi:unnamed protein product [Calicophoron daubneyi]|uniref:TLC domain-containing protein n=1 Tax=Calicophoron daubneyi TaxID=300641 RepID=A0AAV2TGX5_CALDB